MKAININYYDRPEFESTYDERAKQRYIDQHRSASEFLELGPRSQREEPEVVLPTKAEFRMDKQTVSEIAEAKILAKAREAAAVLERVAKWGKVEFKRGDGTVNSPIPQIPHYKETIVGGIQTGPDSFLAITTTNFDAQRVEVRDDGSLDYFGVKAPRDGDKEKEGFKLRGIQKTPDGKFQVDPDFTNHGLAWQASNIETVAKACQNAIIRGRQNAAQEAKREAGTRPEQKPSLAAQQRQTMFGSGPTPKLAGEAVREPRNFGKHNDISI